MSGISPVPFSLLGRARAGPDTEFDPRGSGPIRFSRLHDAGAILLIWAVSAFISLVVAPRYHGASGSELLYYTVYDTLIGAFVGFHLFDRLPRHGFAAFAATAMVAILFGTLVNETMVEPALFGAGPINGEGVFFGLEGALWATAIFLLIRLAQHHRLLQQRAETARSSSNPSCPSGEARCFFVRVAGGTRRIQAETVLYLEADRDFTRIVCTDGEHFVSESLKSILGKSGAFGLARSHKSFAVNLDRVERLARSEVQLGAIRIPVGRRYRAALAQSWHDQMAAVTDR